LTLELFFRSALRRLNYSKYLNYMKT